jgi:DNA-binding CsgD family transcriptional regulator
MDFHRSVIAMHTDDFLAALADRTDPDDLWQVAVNWLGGHGFDKLVHLSGRLGGPVQARTTLGAEFEQHYGEQGFARDDPFMTYCLPAPAEIGTGVEYLDDYGYLKRRERAVIQGAGEAGFRAGFSVVTRREGPRFEAWNIGSSLSRREVEALRQDKGGELRLGLMALRARLDAPAPCPALSLRERQCLHHLAHGDRVKTIAAALGIAPVTVDMHIANARRKLGAATREHALALWLEAENRARGV